MEDRYQAADITLDRESGLSITFGDGETYRFPIEELRVNCPCATCRGVRDQGRTPWPTPTSPFPLTANAAQLVGSWGLSIQWNDGHATGIYPWDALRRWGEEGNPSFTPDSGRGA